MIEQRPNLDGRNMTMMLGPVAPKPESGGDGDGRAQPANGGVAKGGERTAATPVAAEAEEPTARGAEAPAGRDGEAVTAGTEPSGPGTG